MKSGFEKENDAMFDIMKNMEPEDVSKINPFTGFDPRSPNGSSVSRQEKLIPTYYGHEAPAQKPAVNAASAKTTTTQPTAKVTPTKVVVRRK